MLAADIRFYMMNIVTKCEARRANVYKNIEIFDKVSRKIAEKNKTLKILKRELQRLFVTATGATLQCRESNKVSSILFLTPVLLKYKI